MFDHKITLTALVTLAMSLTATTELDAQSSWRSRSYSKSVGNSYLGGSLYAYARASYTRRSVQSARGGAYGSLSANARFFKKSLSLVHARATCDVDVAGRDAKFRGTAYVRLAGKTVMNESKAGSFRLPAVRRTYDLFPRDPRITIPIWGPISITVRGNVGAGLSFDSGFTFYHSGYGGLSATGRAWGHARGAFEVGVPKVVGAGVEVRGNIADQKLSASLGARPAAARLYGAANYCIRAISLRLSAFARFITPFPTCWQAWKSKCWRKTVRKTLTSWSSKLHCTTLLRL